MWLDPVFRMEGMGVGASLVSQAHPRMAAVLEALPPWAGLTLSLPESLLRVRQGRCVPWEWLLAARAPEGAGAGGKLLRNRQQLSLLLTMSPISTRSAPPCPRPEVQFSVTGHRLSLPEDVL